MAKKDIGLYTYRVTWSDDDQEFIGLCAEFPGLSWLEATPEKALKGIRNVVSSALKDLRTTKEDIPEAFSIKNYRGKFVVRVPPETHRHLSIQAAESGVSLNRLISSKLG
jgi:predicted HicB family RNase H-like nuclease